MLEISDLSLAYKDNELVLDGLNFSIKPGQVLAILGPNGVGKTTLLRCINAIVRPSSGSVHIDRADVFSMDVSQIARYFGYVAQHNKGRRITTFDAILLGRKPYLRWKVTKEDLAKVNSVVHHLGLEHLALRYINEMSGGELQKVCIARALVQEPKVLLLDEPTSSLDLKNQMDILQTIRTAVTKHDLSAVMTMHDLNLAFRYSDRFLLLNDGKVYGSGHPHEITGHMIESVYGVKVDILKHKEQVIVVPRHYSGT